MTTKTTRRFVTVSWRAGREPVDDMYWCEAEYDGVWTNVIILDKVRTRREILDRLMELDSAVVGFDFPFSFPKAFIDFLAAEGITGGWRKLAETIRDDLKKNTEDGIRLWIERIGRYRESKLESMEEALQRLPPPRGRQHKPRTLPPHDLRSYAERFRRIDTIIRHKNERIQWSPVAIRHNKLTGRYEFPDAEARGRKALVGIPILLQALESKEELAIWPFAHPAKLTLVEYVNEVFPKPPANDELQSYFDNQEDRAWHFERTVVEACITNDVAKQTLFSLVGLMRAERREEKTIRPLRDFKDPFYTNELVSTEGWVYGIGFRDTSTSRQKEASADEEKKEGVSPTTEEAG